jgi:hypothetical protein
MPHTVALLGPNGNLGSVTLQQLVKANDEGKINLVVFTRPGSAVKNLPDDAKVEIREIDIEGLSVQDLTTKLKGIHLLM